MSVQPTVVSSITFENDRMTVSNCRQQKDNWNYNNVDALSLSLATDKPSFRFYELIYACTHHFCSVLHWHSMTRSTLCGYSCTSVDSKWILLMLYTFLSSCQMLNAWGCQHRVILTQQLHNLFNFEVQNICRAQIIQKHRIVDRVLNSPIAFSAKE